MKSLWIYMLVILVSVKCVASQCIGSEPCDCHCECCSTVCLRSFYCTSCAKGWSGTTSNGCQRQNIAYQSLATSTSTETFNGKKRLPEYAVDEDYNTYSLTKSEPYPQLTLTLSGYFNIRYISVKMFTAAGDYYYFYVTNSASPVYSSSTQCAILYKSTSAFTTEFITCYSELNGNQFVIRKETGSLQVFEINVYQCSQGTYGDKCQFQCINCLETRCNGYTGVCESDCNIGWQGERCDKRCNVKCLENKCNRYTGFCTIGCQPNWYGDTCDRQCPSMCVTSCDRSLGCTNCQIGYNGPNCNPCDGNTYGKNCSLTCQNCENCNNVNGCRECWNGFYGDLCNLECPNQCRNYICSRQSGDCVDGCKDGYGATKCETPCKDNCATCSTYDLCISCFNGRFGTNCEYRCPGTCGGSKTCDKNSGVCSECNPGTFGPNCTQQCNGNCLPGTPSVCDRNGTCIRGCVDGWFGPQCDTQCPIENCEKCNSSDFSCEICNIGYYLDNVQEIRKCVKCPSRYVSCNSGLRCTECIPKFTGYQCENECTINCVDDLFRCEY
eukprot:XP_011447580.2 PREDICTED: multiple epidermal growth factor-like domains protein 10 isoform X1 [Crassostrea gigas]